MATTPRGARLTDLPPDADVRVLHRGMAFSNLGMTLGYRDLWGYDPLVLRRYAQFIAASQGEDPDAADQFVSFVRMPPVFGMLRLRYFFEKAPNGPPVVQFDDPLPRLSLVRQRGGGAGSRRAAANASRERLRSAQRLLLERDSPIALGGMPSRVLIEQQDASTDHLNFVVDIDRNALLLITDNYSTGWRIVTRWKARRRRRSATRSSPPITRSWPSRWRRAGITCGWNTARSRSASGNGSPWCPLRRTCWPPRGLASVAGDTARASAHREGEEFSPIPIADDCCAAGLSIHSSRVGISSDRQGMGLWYRSVVVSCEALERRALFAVAYPTPQEQLLVELINRGRADPPAEAARFGIDLNEGVARGTDLHRAQAAAGDQPEHHRRRPEHSQWMIDNDTFSTRAPAAARPQQRA